jgi:hypothetical protein
MISMKSIPVKQDGFTVRVINEETIFVNEKGDMLHSLNGTGSFIWSRIDGKTSLERLYKFLLEEYDVPCQNADGDILKFIGELEQKGIIRLLE